ncbi:MAG TPA: helix-turn-helix transcriptional regulator [Edaphobacter sp.]|nr:helix-turn-helix transcriptional regulator [Edaphobacter sp.]
MDYLTTWRMQKAATLLQKSDNKVVDVARFVGYDSESTFSKAFKRVVHVAPSEFRRSFLTLRAHRFTPSQPDFHTALNLEE